MSTLYVVATPIGNLADLSPRAKDILSTVPTVVAEDTRITRKLLSYINASPLLISHHLHSDETSIERVLTALDSGDAALVTDAGSPAISDPGSSLVRAVAKRGHDAITIPGPSSLIAALSVSGFEADNFSFGGFVISRESISTNCRWSIERNPDYIANPSPVTQHQLHLLVIGVCGERTEHSLCIP